MKEILVITSYYPPETGAASNRIFHLAEGLHNHDYKISVITPLPNYPTGKIFKGYKGKFKHTSTENGILVNRLWVYASNSKNKILRLLAMLSYSFSLIWFFFWNTIPKTVIIQSPPLLVAFTCTLFLKSSKRKLILNVSDLWPIAGLELGAFKKNFSYKVLEKIERYNYNKADLILGQSEEILTHILSLFPYKNTFLYRNFPDIKPINIEHDTFENKKLNIVYAGLLGVAQGIFKLSQELNYELLDFHIYGSGVEQSKIEALISDSPELSITYHGHVSREELHQSLLQYDLVIIPLLNRIYGSVPSKIFEYGKLGLPMLYFGGGEGETIITSYGLGWVAEAGNYSHLNEVISKIDKSMLSDTMRDKIRETSANVFDFNSQLLQLKKRL
ncbi:glycosyltransferase family 4 protein [uncultured Psychroserpens sp.]|uniref:glycosyltransferase family 4 protein n=1 Tax=uncultured Psychroserpens sp. TaxID=255436 RepID=UPI0026234A9D|nr:glycosyltransferase family 4 protein [uncultured Psychroserpens sp.]